MVLLSCLPRIPDPTGFGCVPFIVTPFPNISMLRLVVYVPVYACARLSCSGAQPQTRTITVNNPLMTGFRHPQFYRESFYEDVSLPLEQS